MGARQNLEERAIYLGFPMAYAAYAARAWSASSTRPSRPPWPALLSSRVMDALFVIPGTGIWLGFDAILGLVPVVGDLIAQTISTYIIWEAHQLGVGKV
jgi:hypothetical protein